MISTTASRLQPIRSTGPPTTPTTATSPTWSTPTADTRYRYDARNRENRRTDALSTSEHWTYDGEGNVLTYTDRKSQLTHYQYDALNRPPLIT